MKSDRLIELLQKASEAFEAGADPFHTEWLAKNEVTLNECYDLSMAISAAIDLMLIPMQKVKLRSEISKNLKRLK